MLTPPSARAWQSLPSVPGLSSRLIVNSFAVGMLGNLLQLCLGNAGRASLEIAKSLVLNGRTQATVSFVILDRWGRVGKGELGDNSRECTVHSHLFHKLR